MAYPTEEGSPSSARRAPCPGTGRLVAVIRSVPEASPRRDGGDLAFGRGRGRGQVILSIEVAMMFVLLAACDREDPSVDKTSGGVEPDTATLVDTEPVPDTATGPD